MEKSEKHVWEIYTKLNHYNGLEWRNWCISKDATYTEEERKKAEIENTVYKGVIDDLRALIEIVSDGQYTTEYNSFLEEWDLIKWEG